MIFTIILLGASGLIFATVCAGLAALNPILLKTGRYDLSGARRRLALSGGLFLWACYRIWG